MSLGTAAHLNSNSPFREIFENGMVPVQNFLPELGRMGNTGVHEFYRVDVARLNADQLAGIAKMVALQCHGSPDEVAAYMRQEGFIPLRALHVSGVSTSSRAFL